MSYVGKITDTSGNTGLVGSTLYGTCSTGASTAAKVVTCSDFDKLLTGVTIHVKFTNSNTASTPTLNVNSTGAKNIYKYGTTKPGTTEATSWYAGSVVSFTYDGSYWQMNDHIDDTNTDANVTQTGGMAYTGTKHRVLLDPNGDDSTRTTGVVKSSGLTYASNEKALTVGLRVNNSTYGSYSLTNGTDITASATGTYASGTNSTASGSYSHAEGVYTTANHKSQHVFGEYNILDSSTAAATARGNYVEIVGNGTSTSARSNARTLDWDGNEVIAGQLTDKWGKQSNRTLTQAQYNALSSSEKNDGTVYIITDADSPTDTLIWNKIGSDTLTTTSQNLSGAVNELNSSMKKLVIFETTDEVTTSVNSGANATIGHTIPSKTGYTPVAVTGYALSGTGAGSVSVYYMWLISTGARLQVHNYGTGTISLKTTCRIMYIRSDYA